MVCVSFFYYFFILLQFFLEIAALLPIFYTKVIFGKVFFLFVRVKCFRFLKSFLFDYYVLWWFGEPFL